MGSRHKNRLSYKGSEGRPCEVCYQPTITRPLRSARDVLTCLKHFKDKRQEYFVTLSIDSGGRLIKRRVVTIGLLDTSLVAVREVFAGPLTDRAASLIVCHNHPSGIAAPSKEDVKTTGQLAAAGELLGLPIQDHIIVTTAGYFSFLEQGMMNERRRDDRRRE